MADPISTVGLLKSSDGLLGQGVKKPDVAGSNGGMSFAEMLKGSLDDMNQQQVSGQQAMSDLATGDVKDLHQAAIAISKAELNMKLMLEVRNKAISAYKEISKTQL